MLYDCKRISYRIDRRLTGLAGPDYAATISFGLPFEPEDSQYGECRLISLAVALEVQVDKMTTGRRRRKKTSGETGGGGDGVADYRRELWRMADALRGSMDAAEYKHVVLGLIFLKYISDAFEEAYARSWKRRLTRGRTRRTRTSTGPRASSGCRRRRGGPGCSQRRGSRR